MILWKAQLHRMLRDLIKILLCTVLIVSLSGCKDSYKVQNYLEDLALTTGIGDEENYLYELEEYGIITSEDKSILNRKLSADYVLKSCHNYFTDEDYYNDFLNETLIKDISKSSIERSEAIKIIKLLAQYINNQKFAEENTVTENPEVIHIDSYMKEEERLSCSEKLKINDRIYLEKDEAYYSIQSINQDGTYSLSEEGDFYSSYSISGSDLEIDFENAQIQEYQGNTSSYFNNSFMMLKSEKEEKSLFGFKLSYVTRKNGIDIRLERDENGMKVYYDFSLSGVKTTYKVADDATSDRKSSYFKADFNISSKLGVSCGKYNYYYLDYRELEADDFLSSVKKAIHTKKDAIEASIPVCTISTPIAAVPSLNFNVDILLNIYVSGKIELVVANKGYAGFECRNGAMRLIKDIDNTADFILGANSKASAALNFNLSLAGMRLSDVELALGIKASLSSIMHLYDENGKDNPVSSDIEYYALDEISRENSDVLICGDVSLNWVMDIQVNTSKTRLYRFGLNKKFEILNKDNQVFGNKTHIENFQFVDKCTRKNKTVIKNEELNLNSDKIILNKYSLVVKVYESAEIPVKSLPQNYKLSDLVITSDKDIVDISGLKLYAKTIGSCIITISTADGRFNSYLNVLVSTG